MKFPTCSPALLVLLTGLSALLGLPVAHAQSSGSSSDKPAAKAPASGSKSTAKSTSAAPSGNTTAAKDGRTSSGERLMTRDELRVCLSRSDALVAKRQSIEREDAALLEERKVLDAQAEDLRRGHDLIRSESEQKQVAFKQRTDQMMARITAFREKTAEDKTGRGRVQSRSELDALERERLQLDADIKTLNVDRDALVQELEQKTQSHNAKVAARDQGIAAFNERHRQYKAIVDKHDAEGEAWRRECGDRPYREDDEKAIRAGK